MLEENRGKIENGETIADLLYRYMTNQWTDHKILSTTSVLHRTELISNPEILCVYAIETTGNCSGWKRQGRPLPVTIRIHFASHPILHPPSSNEGKTNSPEFPSRSTRTSFVREIADEFPLALPPPPLVYRSGPDSPTLATVIPRWTARAMHRRRRRSNHGSTRWIRMAQFPWSTDLPLLSMLN